MRRDAGGMLMTVQVCGEWAGLRTLCGGDGPGPDGVEEEGRWESRTARCVPTWEPAAKFTGGSSVSGVAQKGTDLRGNGCMWFRRLG